MARSNRQPNLAITKKEGAEAPSFSPLYRNYFFGINTLSTTWITPLDCITSACEM